MMSPMAQTLTVEVMGIPVFKEAFEQLQAENAALKAKLSGHIDIETGEDYDASFAELTAAYNAACAREDALRAVNAALEDSMVGFVENSCVLQTEDGLCCYYCEADAEYPDDSGDYEHFELPHTATCIWAKAKAWLADKEADSE